MVATVTDTPDIAPALRVTDLHKRFGSVVANRSITMDVPKGSVHGIVGENGAGKSTLLNMLFGFYQPDGGTIEVDGKAVAFKSAADGIEAGIGMVHQHFMLIEPFTVLENLVLALGEQTSLKAAQAEAALKLEAFNKQFGFHLDPARLVEHLTVGEKQRLEIVKALSRGAETLIMDEPTAVLTPQETDQLFELVKGLKADGKTILFVTHKLHEIMAVTDQVTVIRQGDVVAEVKTAETSADALAEAMVGSPVARSVDAAPVNGSAAPIMSIKGAVTEPYQGGHALQSLNITLSAGEVVGIAGVAGNGQTELLEVLAGMRQLSAGSIELRGDTVNAADTYVSPKGLREKGLAHIPEDRLRHAVVPGFSAQENSVLGYSDRTDFASSRGVLDRASIKDLAENLFESQDIRPRQPGLPVGSFSGGNQQKLVIARELSQNPDILIIGQPTRGVDIGAVTLIHDQIIALRNAGKAILLVSADLDELLTLSDRIMVMCEGHIVGEMAKDDATPREIGLMMAGSASGADTTGWEVAHG